MGPGSTPALTARPPARSQRSASWVADLRTRLPEASRRDHSRGSPEKALPSLGTANPQPGLGVSSAESLPKSNAETPWANQRPKRDEGRVLAPPIPSFGLETRVRRLPGPISGGATARGVVTWAPSLRPRPSSRRAGRSPFIDVSPQGERGFAGAVVGQGRIPALGCGGGCPCSVHVRGAPFHGP